MTQTLSVAVIGAGMAGRTHANAWRQVITLPVAGFSTGIVWSGWPSYGAPSIQWEMVGMGFLSKVVQPGVTPASGHTSHLKLCPYNTTGLLTWHPLPHPTGRSR